MTQFDVKKLRGLKAIVQDAVVNGATSIEQVHMATAARPFSILEKIPAIAKPSSTVHTIHDSIVKSAYATTRSITEIVGKTLDAALDKIEPAAAATPAETQPEAPAQA